MHLNLSQIRPRVCLKKQAPAGTLILVDRPIFCNFLHPSGKGSVWCFDSDFTSKYFGAPGYPTRQESFLVVDDGPQLYYANGEDKFEHGWSMPVSTDPGVGFLDGVIRRPPRAQDYSFLVGMYQERYYLITSNLEASTGPGIYFVW